MVIITYNPLDGYLYSTQIGNTIYMVLRRNGMKYELVHKSEEQEHEFNVPLSIGKDGDNPNQAYESKYKTYDGDIVIVGSDGVFNNLSGDKII